MLWLIYGSSGSIGSLCCEILHIAGQSVISGRRVLMLEDVDEDISKYKPDRVICAIGRTHGSDIPTIDYLEEPGKWRENLHHNLMAPVFIAQATSRTAKLFAPIPTLYIGSGSIYEYEDSNDLSHPFTENDEPNFFGSSYAVIKSATDRLLSAHPHVINMTVMSDILPTLLALTHEGKVGGCVNACNKGWIDHEWILKVNAEKSGTLHEYTLEPLSEQNQRLAAKRSNNVLSTDKLEQWIKTISSETLKMYNVPSELPELSKSIEKICTQRALKHATSDSSDARNLLVTGGCGFIGSNFINYWLKTYSADKIINVDRLDACANPKNIENANSANYKLIVADINNKDLMLHLMIQNNITHVAHFAVQTHLDTSFGNSLTFTESNVFGTHNVLEASRIYGKLHKFVFASTDEVYEKSQVGSCHERSVLNPTNPYAATKAAAEFLIKSYGESFKLPYCITRISNVYGPYQYIEKVIPTFVTAILHGERMAIHGDGKQARNYIYVDDTVKAIELILLKGKPKMIYNIGTKNVHTVLEIADILLKIMKPDMKISDAITHVNGRNFRDCRYYFVTTEALDLLGWKEQVPFNEGVRKTIEWYTNHQNYWTSTNKVN
ncbi:unnamed protein product [Didymodactylos carnosus]|uniref:dTDP-D-glucose 4,6-dehydratase n=1 Tax=Didymodactylos carnosus TaxID=1234261 RepID=A0A8S2D2D6_9BILA|nr:unnamed protein product [Didymodactylos carnosus]CAF3648272.1 unnamed protein product [Didymodactylos carnosus]